MLETSKRLIGLGHETKILCTTATAGTLAEVIDGVPVRRVPYFYPYIGLGKTSRDLLDRKGGSPFSFALMRALKAAPNFDLLHLHAGKRIGGIGRHLARKRGIPYVVSLHGGVFDVPEAERESWQAPTKGAVDLGKPLGWWVGSRRVLDDAAAIICVGHKETQLAKQKYPNKRVVHLPNGVEPARFAKGDGARFRHKYRIPGDAYLVGTVARIDSQKNQMLPVKMLPELLKMQPKTHLLFVGSIASSAYHEELMDKVNASGATGNVTVVPGLATDCPDLVDAYKAIDLFLLPSTHEPFGIVVLEAWAAGTPVLASDVGGVRHLVENGQDAITFDPEDGRSFLEAFKSIANSSELAKRLAQTGCQKAKRNYDWDVITEQLVRIYVDIKKSGKLPC